MTKILLALALVLGSAGGLMWSGGIGSAGASSAAPGLTEIAVPRSSDGHFYATAMVNGVEVRFLVDTGASGVALAPDDAKRAGVDFDPEQFELIGEGASGIVRGQFVKLRTLEVEGIKSDGIEAAVVGGTDTSLLGQTFLAELDEIVIRKDEMLLRRQR